MCVLKPGKLGISIATKNGTHYVKDLAQGGNASSAGVHIGDRLVAAGGHDLAGLSHQDMLQKLTVHSSLESLTLMVIRDAVGTVVGGPPVGTFSLLKTPELSKFLAMLFMFSYCSPAHFA